MSNPERAVYSLPFPPVVNNLFATAGKRRVKSERYAKWQTEAGLSLLAQRAQRIEGPVSVLIELCAPDKRRRDVDNLIKPVLDLLTKHQVIEDDDSRFVRAVAAIWKDDADLPCQVYINSLGEAK